MHEIEKALLPYLEEGFMPGISVWGASHFPHSGVTTCEAFQLHGWEETKVLISASEVLKFEEVIPAWEYEEDGEIFTEPEHQENHIWRFLKVDPGSSRDLGNAAMCEFLVGVLESIDVYHATYQIKTADGPETRRVVAGARFNHREGIASGGEASFGFIQHWPHHHIKVGPASQTFLNLPGHIGPPVRLEATPGGD